MRIEQKHRQVLGVKVGSARNRRKWWRFGRRLALIGRDHMAADAPSARELPAMAGVGRERLRSLKRGGRQAESKKCKFPHVIIFSWAAWQVGPGSIRDTGGSPA